MRILVTGGAGFIGSNLVHYLLGDASRELGVEIDRVVTLDKLTRAVIMVALFWTAYLAEVVRGGLQTIGAGQAEAAQSLGLGYWQAVRLIILPQALRQVIPGLVNLAIGFLLATSLLAVIGAFDLLNTARTATTDRDWLGFYDEAYIFAAAIYFLLCFAGSRYSLWLERRLRRGA